MKIFIKKVPNLNIPKQANPGEDAAYDMVTTSEPTIVGVHIERQLDGLKVWSRVDYLAYSTNIFIAPQDEELTFPHGEKLEEIEYKTFITQYHTLLFPRSSNSGKNMLLCNSVATIDNGYRGELQVRFKYFFQPEDYVILPEDGQLRVFGNVNLDKVYHQGDKIIQLQAMPNRPIEFVPVDVLPPSKRDTGGFGSSGK